MVDICPAVQSFLLQTVFYPVTDIDGTFHADVSFDLRPLYISPFLSSCFEGEDDCCFGWSFDPTCKSLRPVKTLTDKRREAVSARLREHGREAVFDVIRAAGRSSFLAGQNTRGWTADFDWIFRPENFVKVSEGKYENKEKSQQYGTESNRQINERLAVPSHYEVF